MVYEKKMREWVDEKVLKCIGHEKFMMGKIFERWGNSGYNLDLELT